LVNELRSRGGDVNAQDSFLNAPIHYATEYGHTEIVKYLLETAGVGPNAQNVHGEFPITIAAEHGYDTIIELLVKKGADIEVKGRVCYWEVRPTQTSWGTRIERPFFRSHK
jgi:ankyrin repeat protein